MPPAGPIDTHAPATPAIDHAIWKKLVPAVRTLIRLGYFGFEIEGAEHLPKDGRIVLAANHSGWFPLDAFFLALAVRDTLGPERTPFFAAHDAAIAAPLVGPFISRFGALPASWFRRPERLPEAIRTCGIFPEGVEGNCKPFWQAYRMRPWKRGFVRVAVALDAPIVPAAVLGGEECLPVGWTVRLLEPLIGSILGLPLSVVPLPARWKIVFHPPVAVAGRGKAALMDASYSTDMARSVQATVQATLDRHAYRYPLGKVSGFVEAAQRTSFRNAGSSLSAERSASSRACETSLGFEASARRSASSDSGRLPDASRMTARS
jgi:1-acyl-sn-glycerol-3-phosphate acyltransferase